MSSGFNDSFYQVIDLNSTRTKLSNLEFILQFSFWSIAILVDTLIIILVFKSKSSLIRVEYFILTTFQLVSVLINLTIIIGTLKVYVSFNVIFVILLRFFSFLTQMILSFVLFYYALFHLSSVNRSGCFRKLFNLVHNSRNYFFYLLAISIFGILFLIVYSLVFYSIEKSNNNLIISNFKDIINKESEYFVAYVAIWFTTPPILVYLIAIGVLYFRQLKFGKNYSIKSESQFAIRYRRNLRVLLKFSILAINNILSNLPVLIYYFIRVNCNCNKFEFLGYLTDSANFIFPILLVLIHNILKKTLFEIFSNIYFTIK